MTYKHIVKIKTPCPIRVGFFSINKSKEIGFSFDNLAAFQFRENTGVGNDLKKWIKENGENKFFAETMWGAAESFSMHNKKDIGITKEKFMIGIAQITESESKRLIDAWNYSTVLGQKKPIGKKKSGGEPLSFSDMYAYCIGECGLKPSEFWKLTDAETSAIITGHQILMSEQAANFRNLFVAIIKTSNPKEKRSAEQIWSLPTDFKKDTMTYEERKELYANILCKN